MRRMYSEKQLEGLIKEQVEGGELSNAKPIYWHTLFVQRGGTEETSSASRLLAYIIILNNSSEAITLDEFKSLLNTTGFIAVLQ